MIRNPRIFVSAGEPSGDYMLGEILQRLRLRYPSLELCGLGGEGARASGLHPLFSMEQTAFSGIWDVVRNAFFAFRMHAITVREMHRFRPDLVLLVDYPGLNLRLAREARNLGVAVYFVSPPQAWAYRNSDKKARRACKALQDCRVQVLFPFEAEFYTNAALQVTSGHFFDVPPLRNTQRQDNTGERDKNQERNKGHERGMLCLCPGSRLPVLARNLSAWLTLLEKSGRFAESEGRSCEFGNTTIAVLVPEHLVSATQKIIDLHPLGKKVSTIRVRTDKTQALREARQAIAFPGTMTLELALAGVPTLVMGILDPLTFFFGKRLLKSKAVALPNLLLGQMLYPEWVGPTPGPNPALFRNLLSQCDDLNIKDSHMERLLSRMGPGDGVDMAVKGCLGILG